MDNKYCIYFHLYHIYRDKKLQEIRKEHERYEKENLLIVVLTRSSWRHSSYGTLCLWHVITSSSRNSVMTSQTIMFIDIFIVIMVLIVWGHFPSTYMVNFVLLLASYGTSFRKCSLAWLRIFSIIIILDKKNSVFINIIQKPILL